MPKIDYKLTDLYAATWKESERKFAESRQLRRTRILLWTFTLFVSAAAGCLVGWLLWG